MLHKLKPKSEFAGNVLTLMTGTTIAEAIPVAISPVLTRIYTPKDFGVFVLFMAISTIFGSVANGRYELAVMLPEKDEDAINIAALGMFIVTSVSLVLFIIILFFHGFILDLLGNKDISLWLYFIPMAIFFIGLFNVLNYLNIRMNNYKVIAKANIHNSLIRAFIQLSVGIMKSGASGLISGVLISRFFTNLKLFKGIIPDNNLISNIKIFKIKELGKRYINFPKFSVWAILLNTLSQNLLNILVSSFYTISTLGFYSLVNRVLGIPATLLGNSIGQVFFKQATKEKQETGNAMKSFNAIVIRLFFIGLPIFLILFFIIEDMFVFVFGEKWRLAGKYAHIVIPLFFVRFISSPVAIIVSIFEKQQYSLLINIILILTSIGSVFLSWKFNMDFTDFLKIFTQLMSLNYFLFLFYYYKLAKGKQSL